MKRITTTHSRNYLALTVVAAIAAETTDDPTGVKNVPLNLHLNFLLSESAIASSIDDTTIKAAANNVIVVIPCIFFVIINFF